MEKKVNKREELGKLRAYELVKEEYLDDIKSLGMLFRHKKTDAKIVVLNNDDENKVFSIGFRTPPEDSTGVAHIVEHTVLCGSKQFPAKDPFVELAKGSLNTFLNAMTYPDKTIYPVASCNDKDFQNLMHVYLDAVFYPNIYRKEEIFKQEGWHYELEKIEDEITYNGVVYNEMKGVYSSPEQKLFRMIQESLFPDTPYGKESGGDPLYIPDLSYQEYLEFHKKYYHPTNGYIYLYGNMNIEEKLEWMDENYLSKFEKISINSAIPMQRPFNECREMVTYYPLAENETEENKTYLSYNVVIDTALNKELYLAFQVLEYALLDTAGAPLKQALIDREIGKDVLSSYDNGILQPIFSIIAKDTKEEKKELFLQTIKDTITSIAEKGIDERALKAAINYFEFKYREADFGQYPKGLMYGIQILDSWLYDEQKPFLHMKANETFAFLKEQIGTGYFEGLLKKYFLRNTHTSIVIVKPQKGLTQMQEKEGKKKLEIYKNSLTKEQLQKIIEDTKHLRAYQEEPSKKEELELIPMLSRDDMDKKGTPVYNEEKNIQEVPVLHHNIYTNGIGYLRLAFDINDFVKYAPHLSLFATVLGYMDTENYSYLELANEINIDTGGIVSDIMQYNKVGNIKEFIAKFEIRTKVLYDKLPKALELIKEIIYNGKFRDEKRLKEIIAESRSRLQMKMNATGHSVAVLRGMSYVSTSGVFNDETIGIGYYRFLVDLEEHFEDKKEELIRLFESFVTRIFNKDNLLVSYTGDEKGYSGLEKELCKLLEVMPKKKTAEEKFQLQPICRNEGFKTSGQVQYVARMGNFIEAGFSYTGALKVLKVILSYDYLWNNVRVKGGAYGCMCGFSLNGEGYFTSYRDPNLKETNEIYASTGKYIEKFSVDERDMTKYIIGAISSLDTPLSPYAKGARSFAAYVSGLTNDDIQRDRDQVLEVTEEKIRELAPLIQVIIDAGNICVIGNEDRIEDNKNLFKTIENLF